MSMLKCQKCLNVMSKMNLNNKIGEIIRNLIFKEMSLLDEYQLNAIKIKVTNYYFIFLIKKNK
jgi:ADP-dependent phosphofructokinase/glucokinase